MKIVFILPVFVAIAQLHAADSKPPLTRIEYRSISPKIQPDSFAAKPKILYIGGTTYSRMEEQADPLLGIHGLIVVAEPDIWMVNLIPRVAQHIVDPGPTFNTHHNILDRNAPEEFSTLEFGKEVEFFRSHQAASLTPQSLDGQRCDASEFRHADYRIVLFTRADTQKPFHLDVFRDDKPYFSIRYLTYERDLPFDPELFKPPTGVKIVEGKPSDPQ
ncbi:hypothetical protein [Roseimicrobium sp. ORNL1]|uniref:hypothetical protein n=1 Tax=Roseimicrobium sp. ORNL1 TaxID=2711231 RepID=UPI0013E1A1D0|nr:hypothetical protein [Roseimicrobium sp. ORNL1]QIF02390.1 hypothetical protein G5S37_12940 [Roseimicrobium sp. ORNL1]